MFLQSSIFGSCIHNMLLETEYIVLRNQHGYFVIVLVQVQQASQLSNAIVDMLQFGRERQRSTS